MDRTVDQVSADDYDGLLIPGGVANGDFLRADEDAVRFTKDFASARKPIAADNPHPVQKAFIEEHDIRNALANNLCRCGGTYVGILRAVQRASSSL